jgi:hypothetical protein
MVVDSTSLVLDIILDSTSSSKGRVEDVNAQCIGLRCSAMTRHVGGQV